MNQAQRILFMPRSGELDLTNLDREEDVGPEG